MDPRSGAKVPTPEDFVRSTEAERARADAERSRAEMEKNRADAESARADAEKRRADEAEGRAERTARENAELRERLERGGSGIGR